MSEENPNPEEGNEDPGAAATLTPAGDWRENLDPSIKDHPALANLATPADVAKSYVNAQQLIGKKGVPLPGKESDPLDDTKNMEWNTVYDTLGRPSDPKAYDLPVIEGAPEVPDEVADSFKSAAHKLGLLPHQVAGLYRWNQDMATGHVQQSQESMVQGLQESEAAMRQEYGKQFDSNIQNARGLINKFGGEEVSQALEQSGMGNNPHLIRMMVKIAGQFSEDGNIHLGEAQPNILSPKEAKDEIDKVMADKKGAYWNPPDDKGTKQFSDSEHKAMVKKVADLNAMAFPGQV